MVHEQMTVHQALCELKTLNKRISKAINETAPIATKECASQKVNGMSVAEFKIKAQSAHDSAVGLIKRQRAIKDAISQYNASKVITVCGREYTIAQAIWEMRYGMAEERSLLDRYTAFITRANTEIELKNGDMLQGRAESAMNAIFGNKDKANAEEYLKGIADYKEKHALEIVDPLGVSKIIFDLEKEIADFQSNVDSAIQVANATTTLEIAY